MAALAAVALAGAAGSAPEGLAASLQVEGMQRISSHTPFPGPCGRDSPIVNVGAEVEPYIAVHPRNPRRLAVAWMQDSGRSNVVASSRDGGRTWTRALVPGLSECTGGVEPTAADPWLSFGAGRSLYLGSVVGTIPETTQPLTGMVASRSLDGGRSWRVPRFVQPVNGEFWDKPTITADPRRARRAYLVFDRRTGEDAITGLSYVARTDDGGSTWSPLHVILDPGTSDSVPASNIMSILENGTLLNVGFLYGAPERVQYLAQRSRDRGVTWSRRTKIGDAPNRQPVGATGAEVSALALPSTAVAPDGTVYVVWADLESTNASSVRIARSRDGGRSWSRARIVTRLSGQAFVPAVAVTGEGTVGVLYYRARPDDPADPEWTTDVLFSYSRDGARRWRTKRIARPFDLNTAERDGGELFLGDYEGLAGRPHGFAAAFAQAKPRAKSGYSDIFFARLRVRR